MSEKSNTKELQKGEFVQNYVCAMYSTSENPNVKVQSVYHWE
jgi:hypothetical protein